MTPDPQTNNLIVDENPGNSERQSSKWDIRNAPRNYFWLVTFQVGSALFSFASILVLTRYLGSDGYGGIVAIVAASQVAQVLVNWTSVAVVRFGVDEFIETEKIARTFWIRLIVLAANLALVLIFANLWFPPLASWLKISPELFWLVVCHFAVTALWVHVQMSLQGTKQPKAQGLFLMFERLGILVGLILLVGTASLNVNLALVCYIAAPAIMIFVGLYQLRGYVFGRFRVDSLFTRKIIAFSLPLLPFSLVGYFAGSYVDAIFVTKYLSISDLGIYSVATQINGIALQLPTLANSLLLPLFVTLFREKEFERLQNYFRNVLPTLTLLWGFFCTLSAFVAHFAIPLVFGDKYQASTLPLWILLTASAVGIPVAIGYSAVSNATSTTHVSMVAAILAALTNILANFILIPRYGIAGCAAATLMAFFVSVSTFSFLIKRQTDTPVSWVFAAFMPSMIGTFAFVFFESSILGIFGCIAATILIAYCFRDSLNKTLSFVRNYRTT